MRIPYISSPEELTDPEDQAIVARIRERRGKAGLLPLDQALLQSPPVADGWNTFLGAIRTSTTLCPSFLESCICRIAVLNRAWFEWEQHCPLLLAAEGVTPEFVHAIFSTPPASPHANSHWPDLVEDPDNERSGPVLDEPHALVLEFTDALTLDVSVPLELFGRVRDRFGEREVVELCATVAAYNCVSRFLVALDVGERLGDAGMHKALKAVGMEMPEGIKPAPVSRRL